jgi:thioredoxin reductase (NADPH)
MDVDSSSSISGTVHRQVVIVGSGPSGLTAALYTARANLAPLVLEGEPSSTGDQPGGQLMLTTDVENFPGFPDGIMGPELMGHMRAQAERFGATLLAAKATRLELVEGGPHTVWYTDPSSGEGAVVVTEAIVLSMGARSLMLGVPSEMGLLGHGLSTCATCDGFFFRGQHIAVVGGGDSALEEAIFLTRFAASVSVVHRRHELRASKIMQERAFANPKIRFVWDSVVTDVVGQPKVEGLKLANVVTGAEEILPVTGVFVAIGHAPSSELVKGQVELDDLGYVITHGGTTATSVDGVFAAGDIQDHRYRQAVTAAGSGCMAALDVERWLEAKGIGPEVVAPAEPAPAEIAV